MPWRGIHKFLYNNLFRNVSWTKKIQENFCVLLCYTIIHCLTHIKSKFYFVKRNERGILQKIKLGHYLNPSEKEMFGELSEKNF